MTHGALKIIGPDKRVLLLHTYHTAMNIPKIVREAPGHWATLKYDYIPRKTRKGIADELCMMGADNGFQYAPTVASMLIARAPTLFEVYPEKFAKDLTCGCAKDADILEVNTEEWRLATIWEDPDKRSIIKINYRAAMVEALCMDYTK